MLQTKKYQLWFVTGSQHLYGEETIQQVEEHSRKMVQHFNECDFFPAEIVLKPVLTNPDSIRQLTIDANSDSDCAGLITWMHTFSPAKMWIAGLKQLSKPLLHLHTQFNRDIPWNEIDMDFMNLNQSAHGDREYGFMTTRLNKARKVVVGHWESEDVKVRIGKWISTAISWMESQSIKVARFGDNMREVAVTEGDKVEAQIQFGWSVYGFGIGDLVQKMNEFSEEDVYALFNEYKKVFKLEEDALQEGPIQNSILEQARIELGLRAFLEEGGFTAFTTTFEDLHGMKQLPGLAVQRLMADGYGFAGEGDWKTAALLRLMKIMANNKGTSFMEDYTYHFEPENELVLGSHMLEVCPTIATDTPKIAVHPLSIGGKEDPARLIFNGKKGRALNVSVIDLGHRFRLVINEVEAVDTEKEMPNLPVAQVLWKPLPSLSESAEAWIYAGGAHHTVFSYEISPEQIHDLADMFNVESVNINEDTTIRSFQQELRWNEIAYKLNI
ncbi:L-arabinose isomerase [Alkalihalobacillus trypoxylicola]|uniref:L-arabinose isomerase n=1 Tax=Alkalihalobacillus trypoxylicola TaxID=519424 RepID=A0A161PLM9_9BACI|nr:L-arabinose isomerase [Alkalihalobacillus trypoxylicola]KYG34843.1 L-arabinose isomerase [Alkalihalobacillus trypoxylicola]